MSETKQADTPLRGPWEPIRDTGYGASDRPWVLRRRAEGVWGGYQTMQTRGYKPRRFASEDAAKKAATAENNQRLN